MKSQKFIVTPPKLFSGFALGNNSIYVVTITKYKNYEIKSRVTLFVGHSLASKRYYSFHKKSQNSSEVKNFDVFDL